MGNPEYPQRTPDPDELPNDVDGNPEDGLVDNAANYNDAGETEDVDMPERREPVDVRVSRPAPIETKTAITNPKTPSAPY
jgi:hypothetical protein